MKNPGKVIDLAGVFSALSGKQLSSMHRFVFLAFFARGLVCHRNGRRIHRRMHRLAIQLVRFFRVANAVAAMRRRLAIGAHVHEHHLFDRQDALARDLVAHFAAQGDRRAAKVGRRDAEFNDVALTRRTHEVHFGDELGHDALVVQLANRVDGRLFVDPAQQAAAEQDIVFQTTIFVKTS